MQAFTIFEKKCVMCWMCRQDDWQRHVSNKCSKGIGTNKDDLAYSSFRSKVFRLVKGWCWPCLTYQVFICFSFHISSLIYIYIEKTIQSPVHQTKRLSMERHYYEGHLYVY